MTPTRVLHAHAGNLFGGVEAILLALVRHAAAAPQVSWRFALAWTGRLSEELTAAGAAPAIVGAARLRLPWTVWAARAQLRRLLARDPCDVAVVHSTWALAVFGPVFARAGIPLVWWMHSPLRGPAWIERLALRTRPAAVLANSRFTARHVPAAYAGVPLHVVYAPVAPPIQGDDRAALRAELGVADDQALILHVGRLEAWKGQHVLLEALARLGAPGWLCAFAGGAQRPAERRYERELAALAQRLGLATRVRFLGQRADVPGLLAAADMVALPSTMPEGFGIALVEAMYAGRAVVVSDLGPTPEIADDSCASLVAPGDADALAAALRGLLADPARRAALGRRARDRAAERCGPGAQLARLADVFTGAARG